MGKPGIKTEKETEKKGKSRLKTKSNFQYCFFKISTEIPAQEIDLPVREYET